MIGVPEASDRRAYYAGSSQTLAGDLIRGGVTGVAAQVTEPYFDGAVRPDILFPLYARGFNLAEVFYLSMPSLSWQTVVIGDPLCSPFSGKTLSEHEIDAGIDPKPANPGSSRSESLHAPSHR